MASAISQFSSVCTGAIAGKTLKPLHSKASSLSILATGAPAFSAIVPISSSALQKTIKNRGPVRSTLVPTQAAQDLQERGPKSRTW
ncbi:hypothetical protein BR1R5_18830 [Pseudomonas sp. BR1R-5]|nr:hypothetical protein BR1R5_18830 [Pseudomonas sp. BR1R-5]